ncbi:hypothetical protein FRC02_001704 [Tulasnella sp. 418]|nr:hypothetical protein FRC02_001704 [Tulasnella sp. 418]
MPPVPSPFPLAPHGHPHHQQQLQQQQQQPPHQLYPALHLYPLNDSFVPKQIALPPGGQHVKIGRQTNAKTVPGERNGYFDSKVLSRQHAEVWEEGGKIFIRDVKSSNGTFINGERLSQEGIESDPFELKTDDTVEFGIDIVGEDNKTIIHHKVAAKVICVLGPEDLQSLPLHASHAFQNRRATIQGGLQQNSAQGNALGGMGAPRGTKSGLTFEHILSRLQNELQKSRETGQELNNLNGVMTDIHDTIGGTLPPNLPSYPPVLPPVRPPQEPAAPQVPPPALTSAPVDPSTSATLTALQTQMSETQANINAQLDKIRQLEKLISDNEMFKREMVFMREQMEERKREVEIILTQRRSEESANGTFSRRRDAPINVLQQAEEEEEDDGDDARSVSTAVPEERYSDDEGDEEDRRRRDELDRPRTPEPTRHLEEEYEEEQRRQKQQESSSVEHPTLTSSSVSSGPPPPPYPDLSEIYNQNAILTNRLEAVVAQLDSAMELSRSLENQTKLAQETIASLEAKVGTLEAYVEEQRTKPPVEEEKPAPEPSISQSKWDEWREQVEGGWKTERESWESERTRLADAVKEWERRMVDLERKEEERREREEREEERKKVVGFNDSDELISSSSGVDEKPDVFGDKKPKMVNGITKHRKARRRKNLNVNTAAVTNGNGHGPHHGLPNGTANGDLPPSPASPTSSLSGSSAPTHSKSPSSSPASSLRSSSYDGGKQAINGKIPLPLSPPNTSPRSRPDSLALDDDDTSSLGLTASKANSIVGSVHGPSSSGMPLTKRHATSDIPMQVISAAGIVVIGVAAWAVVNRMKD